MEQIMKKYKNCAILQNGAILECFLELLRNSDWYGDFFLVFYFQDASFDYHEQNTHQKRQIFTGTDFLFQAAFMDV